MITPKHRSFTPQGPGFEAFGRGPEVIAGAANAVEIRAIRGRVFDFLIPVLVTGIQPDQVLGLKELLPRRGRGAAGSL